MTTPLPRTDPEDRPVHAGPHHFAPCGEWRPQAGNRVCPYCTERCPACGSHRHYPGSG